MIEYVSVKEKNTSYFSFVMLLAGLVFFVMSDKFAIAPFILQLLGLVLIVFSVQLMQRYVLSSFVYIIDDNDDGTSLFTVVRIQGERKKVVCSLELNKCVYAGPLEKMTIKTKNSFDYKQNFFKKESIVLVYFDGDENVLIKLEADESFGNALISRVTTESNK